MNKNNKIISVFLLITIALVGILIVLELSGDLNANNENTGNESNTEDSEILDYSGIDSVDLSSQKNPIKVDFKENGAGVVDVFVNLEQSVQSIAYSLDIKIVDESDLVIIDFEENQEIFDMQLVKSVQDKELTASLSSETLGDTNTSETISESVFLGSIKYTGSWNADSVVFLSTAELLADDSLYYLVK